MSDAEGKILLRVRSADGNARTSAFDALILSTDRSLQPRLSPSRLTGMPIPFERELPAGDVTVIVRTTDGTTALVSDCDVLGPDGKRKVYGRSSNNLAVFVCSEGGIMVTGLPGPGSDSGASAS